MTLKERAKKLKTDVPAVFLALKQPETPWYAKVMAALTVAYALSPIDLVPDFIPVLGYLDDLLLLPAMIALSVKGSPWRFFVGVKPKRRSCGRTESPRGGIMPSPFC